MPGTSEIPQAANEVTENAPGSSERPVDFAKKRRELIDQALASGKGLRKWIEMNEGAIDKPLDS
jgi:hypothetical protein